jgi:cation:H+ antiporter
MIFNLVAVLACAVVIYLSCEYFVNGVEWVGLKFGVAKSAVGTVLAAFGTALPESVVTFVAVVMGNTTAQKQIGVGAALGGPLVLSTIAYAVVGIAFLAYQRETGAVLLSVRDQHRLANDQGWFLLIFAAKVALGLFAFVYKPWLGILFIAAYALYTWREMTAGDELGHDLAELEPLKFQPRKASPSTTWATCQTVAALVVIFVSSQLFVHQLEMLSPALGLSPQLTALLLSPVATELPEIMNAIIWLRQGKTTLALGNISGAMMIQATIPSALGIMFTPWILDNALIVAGTVTFMSIATMWLLLKRGLLSASKLSAFGLLYLIFAGIIAWQFYACSRAACLRLIG